MHTLARKPMLGALVAAATIFASLGTAANALELKFSHGTNDPTAPTKRIPTTWAPFGLPKG